MMLKPSPRSQTANGLAHDTALVASGLGVALPKGRGLGRLWGPRHWALRHIDFELKRGETMGVLGRNGAGKSTLLRALAGIIMPDEGTLRIAPNLNCVILAPGAGFDNELTGRENVYASALFHGHLPDAVRKHIEEIIEFSEIGEWIDEPVSIYSAGMRARLGFSLSLFMPSDVLMIDETLSAGDTAFRQKAREAILSLISSGRSVIVVSHNLDMMRILCSRGLLIDRGKQISFGSIDDVITEYHDRNTMLEPELDDANAPTDSAGLGESGIIETLGNERLVTRIARRNTHAEYLKAEQKLARASARLIELQTAFIDQLRSGDDAAKLRNLDKRCSMARERMEKAQADRDQCFEESERARTVDERVLQDMREFRTSAGASGSQAALAEGAPRAVGPDSD